MLGVALLNDSLTATKDVSVQKIRVHKRRGAEVSEGLQVMLTTCKSPAATCLPGLSVREGFKAA